MRENFTAALAAVLEHEGGFVDHPKDPGGATNKGITQTVYDTFRDARGLTRRSVRYIGPNEIQTIYRDGYWDKSRCDDLPAGLDYCVFDFAVNSGVRRASRFLQNAVGAVADGKIGPLTLAAVRQVPPIRIIGEICDARLRFLRSLSTFADFGRGWSNRVAEVRARAMEMAA